MLIVAAALIVAVAELVKERAANQWLVLFAALTVIVVQLSITFHREIGDLLAQLAAFVAAHRTVVAGGTAAGLLVAAAAAVAVRAATDDACPHTTELRILTSPEGLQTIREVTRAYVRATADDGCPTIFPYVYAAGTPAVSGALARGWVDTRTEHPLVDLGPRPDVWLPDSTVDVRQVRDILARTLPDSATANGRLPAPLRAVTPVASSPIVLAGKAAAADGAPTLPGQVSELLAQPGAALAAADPESSAAGLLAAAGYLLDERSGVVDPAVARGREQLIGSATPSATDEVSLLCAYLRRGQAPAAVLTSLRTWRRMVAGKAMGAGCPAPQAPPPGAAGTPPAVVEGPALDHPFVQFTWSGARHARAAGDLLTWLRSGNARPHLRQAGLDPPLPGCAALDHNPCVPTTLDAMLEVHRQAKLPGRVLLAVDSSGSMGARTGPGATRFTVAAQGVVEALGHLGPHDDFGLWSFPSPDGGESRRLAGVAPGSLAHRRAVADALRAVRPAGGTPLYATILAGLREVGGSGDEQRIRALVVLTDGEDTTNRDLGRVAAEVRRLAGASGARLYVIATGDARCEDTGPAEKGLRVLTDAARGECLATSPGKADATMAQLFATLWGGR